MDAGTSSAHTGNLDRISQNLRLIGGLSISEFLALPAQPIPDVPEPSYALLSFSPTERNAQREAVMHNESIGKLYVACQQAFPGAAYILKFDYSVSKQSKGKQCTLTITRPNGVSRIFRSDDTFAKKEDAQAQVCDRAVALNAIDFILYGALKRTNLTPLEAQETQKEPSPKAATTDQAFHDIEAMCDKENLLLKWYYYSSPDPSKTCGAALRVSSGPFVNTVYSCLPTFQSFEEAQLECARHAIRRGILELHATSEMLGCPPTSAETTLQSFYDSLPRPFPDPTCEKSIVSDVDIATWLNKTLQAHSGHGVKITNFHFHEGALHGYLLRIARNGEETRSCIVDARFTKKADAKAAVTLLAMSEGLGSWIEALSKEAAERVTPTMRQEAQSISSILESDCPQVSGHPPQLHIERGDGSVFSATLSVPLSSIDVRTFQVPQQYASKGDARAAVYHLVKQDDTLSVLEARTGRKRQAPLEREDGEIIERPPKKRKVQNNNNNPRPASRGVPLSSTAAGPSKTVLPPRPPPPSHYRPEAPPPGKEVPYYPSRPAKAPPLHYPSQPVKARYEGDPYASPPPHTRYCVPELRRLYPPPQRHLAPPSHYPFRGPHD